MPGRTGILIQNVWILCLAGLYFVLQVYVPVFVFVYRPFNLSVLLLFLVADSERAARSGDEETTGLFQSDATTWCVGRDPAVTYVAPLASSFTAPLAASQQHYVTHTQTHS